MERENFMDAVGHYQDLVYRVALHAAGSPQDAEDVVQEVFLRLFLEEKPFAGPEHLRRWLIRVTVNAGRDLTKSAWRKRRVPLDSVPEPVFEAPEQQELYREVLALPESYRTVLYLFYYEGYSTKEIGEILGIRQSAVTTRLSRARALLKKRLTEVL
jgi:RNA polymerase sigma factor (sigma-70 family)